MKRVAVVGLDIAADVFQAHGADVKGAMLFNRKLRRSDLLPFFKELPVCIVAIEACSTAYHWARSIEIYGHDVRLIHPAYVKPFVKRSKTDAKDAEAISEAVSRPNMRLVPIRSAEQQAGGLSFRLRALLVRQRAQMANALRSQLAEFGVAVPDVGFVKVIAATHAVLKASEPSIPSVGHFALEQYVEQLEATNDRIIALDHQLATQAKHSETVSRLMTVPGVGPMTALAVTSLAPAAEFFESARHFSAWVGLTPRNHSSGGKEVLGAVTKMGNRQIRALLVIGAMAALKGVKPDDKRYPWLARLKQRRPYKVAAVALANKNARIIWALLKKGGTYKVAGAPFAADLGAAV